MLAARIWSIGIERHPHRVNAIFGPLIVAERQIGGWIAELAAAGVAFLDHALDRIVAAQQPRRLAGLAGDQRFAYAPGGHALALDHHLRHGLSRNTAAGPQLTEERDVAPAPLAEAEVVAGHDAGRADAAGQHL